MRERGDRGGAPAARPARDVLALARTGGGVSGEVDARALSRLSDTVLHDMPSPVRYEVRGTADSRGRPALSVEIGGDVRVTCQRCLRPMTWLVSARSLIVIAATEAEAEAWDQDEPEVMVADRPLSAVELVEDELVLSLPYAPRHTEDECEAAAGIVVPAARD